MTNASRFMAIHLTPWQAQCFDRNHACSDFSASYTRKAGHTAAFKKTDHTSPETRSLGYEVNGGANKA
jgi:hypothetical protein